MVVAEFCEYKEANKVCRVWNPFGVAQGLMYLYCADLVDAALGEGKPGRLQRLRIGDILKVRLLSYGSLTRWYVTDAAVTHQLFGM